MSSSTDEELFYAFAEQIGMPPALIANARRDPIARAMLQNLLATHPPPGLRAPQVNLKINEKPEERFKREMDAAMKQFEQERDRPLRRPSPMPRHGSIVSLNAHRDAIVSQLGGPGNLKMVTSYMGLPKTFSDKPLSQLTRINLNEMLVTQQHKGRYLLGRIISKPIVELSASMIFEDPTGQFVYFSVYRYPLHEIETGPDLDAFFPLGQVLAIKEPLYKMNQNGTNAIVRVDSPSDLVCLQPNDPLLHNIRWAYPEPGKAIPTDFDYKAHGNSLFKAKKYLLAVKAYTDGLAVSAFEDQLILLHLNRAQAHLFLSNFASAYRDSSAVLSLLENDTEAPPQTRFKALFRRARALEGMRLLPQAKDAYAEAVSLDPSNVEVKTGKQRVEKMLREAQSGKFDWLSIETEAVKFAKQDKVLRTSDVGDYIGNVKVVKLGERGGGRGVVATRDIKVGELLLVEKAFAIGEAPNASAKTLVMAFDLGTKTAATAEQVNLVDDVVRRMLDDPTTAPIVYSLYGGREFPSSDDASFEAFRSRPLEEDKEVYVDSGRIEAILAANRFGMTPVDKGKGKESTPSGLFINASIFNHSCAGNASWTVTSDLIVVRSRAPIKQGEEVLIPYVSAELDVKQRQGVFRSHFDNARCNCELCKLDAQDGKVKVDLRRNLLEQADTLNRSSIPDSLKKPRMAALVSKMEQTYATSRPIHRRPELLLPYHDLAEIVGHDSPAARREANEYDLKALQASGAVLERSKKDIKVVEAPFVASKMAVSLLLSLAARLAMNDTDKDNKEARLFVRAAIRMDRILRESDARRFIFKYDPMVDEWNLDWMCGLEFENA